MSAAETIKKNFNTIFPDFQSMLSGIPGATGDREIEKWDAKLCVEVASGITIIVSPRVKSTSQRGWLNGEIGNRFKSANKEAIENKLINTLKIAKPKGLKEGESYAFNYKMDNFGSKSVTAFWIEIKRRKKNGTFYPKNSFSIVFYSQGLQQEKKMPDAHELMCACLILRGKIINYSKLNTLSPANRQKEIKTIVDEAYKLTSQIIGAKGEAGFYTDETRSIPDYVTFAKSVSVSNHVIMKLQVKRGIYGIVQIYQTGSSWHTDISRFNPSTEVMKNYNSSDIVINYKTSGKNGCTNFWGISLKKTKVGGADPTLLNKPVFGKDGFITKRIDGQGLTKIENKQKEFFKNALSIKLTHADYVKKKVDKLSNTDLLKLAKAEFDDKEEKKDMLMGTGKYSGNPNIYFREIHNQFMSAVGHDENGNPVSGKKDKAREFFKDFLNVVFKIDIKTYIKDVDFHFSLITGYGDYKGGQLVVNKADEKSGVHTTTIFRGMFGDADDTEYIIREGKTRGSNNRHVFNEGSTAAKLFYIMQIGNTHIVDLEVRYKGSLTSEPQFQVFLSLGDNSFHKKYKELYNEYKRKGTVTS